MLRSFTILSAAAALALIPAPPASAQHVHDHHNVSSSTHASDAGEPGDPSRASRTVAVTMREEGGRMLFTPDRIEAKRGEQIRFALVNAGELDHEFVIGSAAEIAAHAKEMADMPDMVHDEPNGRAVKSKARGELLWRFTTAGDFKFACLIPGHLDAGMSGIIVVR